MGWSNLHRSLLFAAACLATATASGCGDDVEGGDGTGASSAGGAGGSTSTGTDSGTSTSTGNGTGTGTGMGGCEVPTSTAELEAFLAAGTYQAWNAEAAPHPSDGPHFGDVQVYVNDTLFDSLTAGNMSHPVCSTVVKELYGMGATVGGYAAMVKMTDGTSGDDWYWYEEYQGTTYADDTGVSLCTNCHGGGQDFVLTELPL